MMPRITVIGTGYLGATHAACMAELGFSVLGADIDPERIGALSRGRLPFYEPGLEELTNRHVASGRLRFTTSLPLAAKFGDVHFLCVGTPQRAGSISADLGYLYAAVDSLAPHLERPCLLVGKSTVPVGTARHLARHASALAPVGEQAEIAWNPEFLREGHAVTDTLKPDRLVFGVQSERAAESLAEVYADIIYRGTPAVVTSMETAELVKSAANAFLATKISFINAIAEVCDAAGADVVTLARALSYDSRIGGRFLQAGAGFGGGCLPKDLWALVARADELGVPESVNFLREVDAINLRCRNRIIELARQECDGTLNERRICVLGAAFKPDSDDIRNSPALAISTTLQEAGANVTIYDPQAMDNARKAVPSLAYASSLTAAVSGADLLLHLTEWPEFRDIDPADLASLVERRRIVDGRNTLDPARWLDAGWVYRAPGRAAGRLGVESGSNVPVGPELA